MLLFIIILTQGVLFLYLLSHMYCNSIESINIELDHNQKSNSILSVELNVALLDKEQILEDNVIVTVAYEESYVE